MLLKSLWMVRRKLPLGQYDSKIEDYLPIGQYCAGCPKETYTGEFLAYADEPSIVSHVHALHVGSTVLVGPQSLNVGR